MWLAVRRDLVEKDTGTQREAIANGAMFMEKEVRARAPWKTSFLNMTRYFFRTMKKDSATQTLEVMTENVMELTSDIQAFVVNTNKDIQREKFSRLLRSNQHRFPMSSQVSRLLESF